MSYDHLTAQLGYTFSDERLLEQALTHRSAHKVNNERLEFLGDSLVNFVVADLLYQYFPECNEGELSRFRSNLVDARSLACLAHQLELGQYLSLGGGELKSGGQRRNSILADAMEAIWGAVYLDGGVEAVCTVISRLYLPLLETLPDAETLKDSKTRLQEWLQARKFALPVYTLIEVAGQPHQRIFKVRCDIVDCDLSVSAEATSRRKAEQLAAQQVLDQIVVSTSSQ